MNNNQNENPKHGLPEESPEEKKARINRVIYITAVVLLVSIAVIAGIVSAANRAKKDPTETPAPTLGSSNDAKPTLPEFSQNKPESSPSATESSSSDKPSTDVSGKLPEFSLPVSGKLSVSHDPDLQVFSPTMGDYRVHLGIDIDTAEGASVYAAAEGVVKKVWEDPMMGMCVAVAHDGDSVTYYKNLSETLATGIKEGASVRSGQLLGTVGNTAMMEVAQEPHLHFEMTVGGLQVDPTEHFSKDVLARLDKDSGYEG